MLSSEVIDELLQELLDKFINQTQFDINEQRELPDLLNSIKY